MTLTLTDLFCGAGASPVSCSRFERVLVLHREGGVGGRAARDASAVILSGLKPHQCSSGFRAMTTAACRYPRAIAASLHLSGALYLGSSVLS
jgi:hypothetical protein